MVRSHSYKLFSLRLMCFCLSPGRFFVATELKVMLARIVMTYDFKLEEGKEIPRDLCIASSIISRNANVLFRKRRN